ncbi:Wzz/FepE/Etk N-terminal domain-containing protein, partial [Thermovibrio ammonificans]
MSEPQNRYPYYGEDDEIDLYELWLTLKKRKKIVAAVTLIITAIGVAYAFLATPVYRTQTTLIPLGGKSSGLSSILSSLPISLPIGGSSSGLTV